jgi:hypothetical protein
MIAIILGLEFGLRPWNIEYFNSNKL